MPDVPRIDRAVPKGAVHEAATPIPVIACLRWHSPSYTDEDVYALAEAWTDDAVRVRWVFGEVERRDWVPAWQIRRPGDERQEPPRSFVGPVPYVPLPADALKPGQPHVAGEPELRVATRW